MVGDDACTTFVELLKRILDIVSEIEKEKRRSEGYMKKPLPKVKVGKLSKHNFEKLQKAGAEFKFVTIPADKQSEIEEAVKKMGGSYFNAEVSDNNNIVLAVPASQLDLLQMAMKHVVAKDLAENSDKIKVKDGSDLIEGEDMALVNRVLNQYDIPVISFKTDDDKYMNVVPTEYEGQYSKAMKEVEQIRQEVGNIEVTRYDQTAPLDEIDYEAYTISKDEARELYEAAKENNLAVDLVEMGDKVAVKYSKDIADKVEQARNEYKESLEKSEDYIIDVYDNIITLDMAKLNIEELNTDDSYFMRVPNTSAQDYIRISKADSELINSGKTLKYELDFEKRYPVYDKNGKVKRAVSGSELTGFFNTKNRRINQDTKVFKFGIDGGELRRIDLYSAKKNELISVKMGSSDEMKIALKERGLNNKTINKLLEDINNALTDKQKEVFSYTAEKTDIAYAVIPNIGEYLAQSQLSQTVIGKCECMGEIPKGMGAKCCVLDNNTNKFAVIPVLPKAEVQMMLSQMGYSEVSAKEIADKVVGSYREEDYKIAPTPTQEKSFTQNLRQYDSPNAELRDMGYYNTQDSTIIIKDDKENYQYMQIEKETPLSEVEKALREDFGLLDDLSVALACKQLIADGIITGAKTQEHEEAIINQLSKNMVEITAKESGNKVIMPMSEVNTEKLTALGISEKGASDIKKSFDKNIMEARHPDKQALGGIKHFAQEKYKELSQAVKDKVATIGKGQSR